MRLFIDEVGNSDLQGAADDDNVRYLSLTGVITSTERHERVLKPALEAAKFLIPSHSPNRPVIFHRRKIVKREGDFACLNDPELRSQFDDALLNAFQVREYLINTVQIDKRAHLETYGVWRFDPYHYCMRCLIERYVLYLKRHDLQGDVWIEPRYKKADKKLKASYERVWFEGTENISARITQQRLLSKDIVFGPKTMNVAGLQFADLLAHPSARNMRRLREGGEFEPDFGTRVADILMERRYARNPRNGVIYGWGMKWLP